MANSKIIKFLNKKLVKTLLSILIFFVTLELGLRIVLSIRIGPDIFFYGTPFDNRKVIKAKIHRKKRGEKYDTSLKKILHAIKQNEKTGGHRAKNKLKYFPHQKRVDVDESGNFFKVKINSRGFRGKEFKTAKVKNTLRIVTLGASSTFGYRNRENETYSHFLEELLNQRLLTSSCKHYKKIEVINLGVPHLKSGEIYSIFTQEALPLKPDIVTFYEGYNEAFFYIQKSGENKSKFNKKLKSFSKRLLILNVVYEWQQQGLLFNKKTYLQNKKEKEAKTNSFVNVLDKINKTCLKNNICFIAITQQIHSSLVKNDKRKGLTYEKEILLLQKKLTKSWLKRSALLFLFHNQLMIAERRWAKQNNVWLIDGIEALNQHRDCFISHVHLSSQGNKILAQSIANEIYQKICKYN